MPTGLTYNQYVAELAVLAVVAPDDTNYVANLPSCIDWAELAIYQDLDLLQTVDSVTGFSFVAGDRRLILSMNPVISPVVTVKGINVITPLGVSDPNLGKRNALLPVTEARLDMEWPDATGSRLPKLFAPFRQNILIVGPWPDANYAAEVVGTVRPTPLSATNQQTWVSMNLPNLLLAASMVFISGYQHNFGRQADDPQQSVSWQQQYDLGIKRAIAEESQKRFRSQGWTSESISPVATPPRH